ncbi:MAG: GIY-YIG nuclease family protein [Burkholderiaceae bacterium]
MTVGDKRYVGSTIQTIAGRMCRHRAQADPARLLYDAVDEAGGWGVVEVKVLETYPCSSEQELRKRERHWYDVLQPELNMIRPAITDDERKLHDAAKLVAWRAANPGKHAEQERRRLAAQTPEQRAARLDKSREWRRAWYSANRDDINAKRRAKNASAAN